MGEREIEKERGKGFVTGGRMFIPHKLGPKDQEWPYSQEASDSQQPSSIRQQQCRPHRSVDPGSCNRSRSQDGQGSPGGTR